MRQGFSLVELSIVLVILGLLVGGVLSGQSLIRAAELRSVSTESQRYESAVYAFRDRYLALPGDMANATSFWGFAGGAGCANRSGTALTSPGTCDGNSDGSISYGAPGQSSEAFGAWRHLALAKMVEGTYTGVAGGNSSPFGGVDYNFGENSPHSRITNVGWGLSYFNNLVVSQVLLFKYNYLNWLTVGADDGQFADGLFLKPEEAWNIDTKMDDGKPALGKVHGWAGAGCSTAASITDFTADYVLSGSSGACALLFEYL